MNHKNQRSDIYPLFDTFWNNTGLKGTMFPIKIPTEKYKEARVTGAARGSSVTPKFYGVTIESIIHHWE